MGDVRDEYDMGGEKGSKNEEMQKEAKAEGEGREEEGRVSRSGVVVCVRSIFFFMCSSCAQIVIQSRQWEWGNISSDCGCGSYRPYWTDIYTLYVSTVDG